MSYQDTRCGGVSYPSAESEYSTAPAAGWARIELDDNFKSPISWSSFHILHMKQDGMENHSEKKYFRII